MNPDGTLKRTYDATPDPKLVVAVGDCGCNGGIFGEYMFGGHFPVGDLLNDEVVNRLVMFGATSDPRTHELRFTPNTEGFETFDNLFLQGNAVANYFFFIDDRKRLAYVEERQERTVRAIGKLLSG